MDWLSSKRGASSATGEPRKQIMNTALIHFFERHGLKMEWRFRRAFLAWLLTPLLFLGVVILTLLLANPQSNRWVYIFQAMFTHRGGHGPWGEDGPDPPPDYSGTWYRWHRNGRPSFEENFKNGQLDGSFRSWTRSGNLRFDIVYKDGQYDGKYLFYGYDTGALSVQREYSKGLPIGHWVSFRENGTKLGEETFSGPGVLDGDQLSWDESGKMTRRIWREGKPWEGLFFLKRGTNWFSEKYQSGTLLASTNNGPDLGVYVGPGFVSKSAKK